jgi:hypothetical protein
VAMRNAYRRAVASGRTRQAKGGDQRHPGEVEPGQQRRLRSVASGGGRVGLGKGGDQGLAGQGRQRLGLAVQHTSGGVQWREVATGDRRRPGKRPGHRRRRGWPRATARRRWPIAVAQGQKGGRLGGAGSNSLVRCERERLGVMGG